MQVTNGEAEAWLEGSSQPNQTRGEPSPQKNKKYEDVEETSENEEVLEGSQEDGEYQEEDEEEFDEEEEQEDVEEEDEDVEQSEEEAHEENENQQTDRNEANTTNNKDRSPNKNSSRLPQGSPVKRAYTTEKDNRKHGSRALMSHRDRSPNDAKYNSDRAMLERLTGKSLSPTRHPDEFKTYYDKFCKEFLQKREDELEKKRRQKEEDELAQLQHKPTLVSRPQSKPYVPLLERTVLLDARREKELEKIRKEREDKLQREFEEHTFAPKINPKSKNLANSPVRERIIDHYMRSRLQFSHSPLPQRKDRDTFHPKINPNSKNIMAMKEQTSRDVVERLYHRADLGRTKKSELAKQLTPKFTPSLNKNTRKIAKQIEDNYNNGCATAGKQQNDSKRVEKRKRSEIGPEEMNHKREVAHLEQASDFELLEILKQFNGMLEQKNESPINLQQLSTLMQTYSSKKKENNNTNENECQREETEEQDQEEEEEEEEEEVYDEEEEDDYQSSQRRVNTEQPAKSYPSGAYDDATNPMSNIEKNLMHIQGSLQDLKENGHKTSESYNNLRNQGPSSHHEGQSSSYSPNKKAPSSKSSKKKSKRREGSRNVVNTEDYSEGVSSKNSVEPNVGSEKSGSKSHRVHTTEKSVTDKSLRSSHVTPSKSDVNNNQMQAKAPVSTARSAKKEDFSSPEAQKGRKKAQTTTKKGKKVQTFTDQPSNAQSQYMQNKEIKSLNEVFAHSLISNSKNSLEACNSNFDVEDHVEEILVQSRQPQERVKGHAPQHSFGGYPSDNLHVVGQEEYNYRSNRPQEQERPKSAKKPVGSREQIKDQHKGRSIQTVDIEEKSDTYSDEERYEERSKIGSQSNVSQKRGQTQSNVSSKNKIPESKASLKEKTPEKRHSKVKSVAREEEKHDKKSSSTSGKEKSRKSVMQDDRRSENSQQLFDQQEENARARSRKESRKVSFEMPMDSRKSSIYDATQDQRLATEPGRGVSESRQQQAAGSGRLATEPGKGGSVHRKSVQEPARQNKEQVKSQAKGNQRKSMYEQGSKYHQEKVSTFANKSNKKADPEPMDSDDDHPSIHRDQKANIGDYMSFSANTLDQLDEHQAPQDEKRLLDTFESEESKTSSKNTPSTQHVPHHFSPSKQRAYYDVVTTETIQIEPQSAPRFAYAMDVAEKVKATTVAVSVSSSGSGLKAMAEQIVKKFKAYDAQIKQTAREYKLSVSPPRTSSPSPDHYDTGYLDSGSKKETKVFKSVEKSGVSKASKASRNSVTGSITSVQSGADRRFSKR